MGLGPPVCRTCRVLYQYFKPYVICPECGDTDFDQYDFLWLLDEDTQEEFEDNTRRLLEGD